MLEGGQRRERKEGVGERRKTKRKKGRLKERITEGSEERRGAERVSTLCCTTWPTKRPPETFIKATASSQICVCVCVCVCVCIKPAARCSVRSAALRKATEWLVCNSRTSNPLNTSPFAANVQLLKDYSTLPFFVFNTLTTFNGVYDRF